MKLLICFCCVLFLSACSSYTTIEEIDRDTGKVIKRTVTKESMPKAIVTSTQDKTVLLYRRGITVGLIATVFSEDNPVPVLKLVYNKDDEGYIGIHKDQRNLDGVAEIIKASMVSEGTSVNKDGVVTTGIQSK